MPPLIRDAREADLAAILAIYNDVVATSTAIYRDQPFTLEDRTQWFRQRVGQGYPVIVAVENDDGARRLEPSGIAGFATFGDFRTGTGYRYTVEHTVHVRSDRRGGGVGAALMQRLIELAVAAGKHVMVGGVDSENERSIRFHERLGFERSAHMRQVGFKFNRWLDLVLLQKELGI